MNAEHISNFAAYRLTADNSADGSRINTKIHTYYARTVLNENVCVMRSEGSKRHTFDYSWTVSLQVRNILSIANKWIARRLHFNFSILIFHLCLILSWSISVTASSRQWQAKFRDFRSRDPSPQYRMLSRVERRSLVVAKLINKTQLSWKKLVVKIWPVSRISPFFCLSLCSLRWNLLSSRWEGGGEGSSVVCSRSQVAIFDHYG